MAQPVVTTVMWSAFGAPGTPKRMFIQAGQRRIGDLTLARMIANDNPCPKFPKRASLRVAKQQG